MDLREFDVMREICKREGKTPEELLKERVSPLNRRISSFPGQLISAITRSYEGMRGHSPEETLYVGKITPETRLPIKGNLSNAFLLGVNNPHKLNINSYREGEWREGVKNQFANIHEFPQILIYLMDKKPSIPEDAYNHEGFTPTCNIAFPIEKPRLELMVGDKEAIPFLEKHLKGYEYTPLSKLLQYELPLNEGILKKIEEEQIDLFERVLDEEKKARRLNQEKEERIAIANSRGAINHGTHIELTDEFVENLKYNPLIRESRSEILSLIETAIQREYHKTGREVKKRLDAGITLTIDLKEFFEQRKALLEL